MEATLWALIPPILAIVISLITKEVNLSLLIGIIVGAGLYCSFEPFSTVSTMLNVMYDKVYGNMGVLVFIILLGMIVYLMNRSGATNAYAEWARKRLKTKRQTLLATMLLGIIIFVDDYFNCLTVGTVMRPITDKNHVSRERLAYIIDSTAAPICIIAPVASWAAAVSSSLPADSTIDGFQLFLRTISNNFYSLFSLVMVFLTIVFAVDFGKMKRFELAAEKGGAGETGDAGTAQDKQGHVVDLLLPIIILIAASIICMLYTGGLFAGGVTVAEAFADCDAITGLAMGAFFSVIALALLYLPRRIVTPKVFLDSLVEGFKNMVPAALILIFAWTLSGICGGDYLNAGGFMARIVAEYSINLRLMPAIFFLFALLLAFSTGTSWGTFAILIPITVSVFGDVLSPLMVMTTAAVLGGSVCGDHLSPISDTTILSSTGADCEHINHVSTQLQYGLIVAGLTFICYLISGLFENSLSGLILGVAALTVFILFLRIKDTARSTVQKGST